MAALSLVPKNGAIAFAAVTADFASFDIESSQSVENVTPYGANVNAKHVGSGTPEISINIGAFALAHTTGTPAKLDTLPGAGTGATLTLTLDTGVSEACTMIVQSVRLSHARMRAAVPMAI